MTSPNLTGALGILTDALSTGRLVSNMSTTENPGLSNITSGVPTPSNSTSLSNITSGQPLIFLQTSVAQGIAGTFAFAAILVTVHQVWIIIPSKYPVYHFKGFQPEWYISTNSTIYRAWDTPFWLGTLDLLNAVVVLSMTDSLFWYGLLNGIMHS